MSQVPHRDELRAAGTQRSLHDDATGHDDAPGNSGAPRPRAASPARQELEALTAEFAAWFAPRERRLGAGCWSAMRADARRLAGTVADMERLGLDLADKAVLALLPYDDLPELRGSGAFCHVLPGLTRDPRAWFADAGWTAPEDWPALSRGLFLFVRRCDENPGELWQACHELVALPGSRGFDSALLSPILNALRPDDFLVVNAATRATLNHFTGSAFGPALSEYPEVQVATRRLIENSRDVLLARAPSGMRLGDCFAVFSHWLMNERLHAGVAVEPAVARPQAAAAAPSQATLQAPSQAASQAPPQAASQAPPQAATAVVSEPAAPEPPAAPRETAAAPPASVASAPSRASVRTSLARALAEDEAVAAGIAARAARAARALRAPASAPPDDAPPLEDARANVPAASAALEPAEAAQAPAVSVEPPAGALEPAVAALAPAVTVEPAESLPHAEAMADNEWTGASEPASVAEVAEAAEAVDVVDVVEACTPEAAVTAVVEHDAPAEEDALPEDPVPPEPRPLTLRHLAARPVRGHDASPEAAIALAHAPQAPHAPTRDRAQPDRAAVAAHAPAADRDPAREALDQLVGLAAGRGQLMLCGRPGAGTARWAEAVANELRHGDGLAERLVFHPGWTRADFLQSVDGHGNRRAGRFTEFCRRAAERKGRSVLIIHALQRADADAVFAEALELLDLRDVECSLAGSGSLAVPACLAIVAGCETSDGLPPDAPAITQHFACAGVPGVQPPGTPSAPPGQ